MGDRKFTPVFMLPLYDVVLWAQFASIFGWLSQRFHVTQNQNLGQVHKLK
jgi:hypothetical protein